MNHTLKRKIADAAALAQTLREHRAAGRKIVQCHGCFDIVHPGHVRYLESARRLGDLLIVSLTGDDNVAKGPDRPYIPQELRAENLAALEFVDWVVIDPHPTALELIEQLRPDIYVKGREYATSSDPRFLREREQVESYGGRVVFHSGEVVFSSTRLIEGLRGENRLEDWRLQAFCRRCGVNVASVDAALEAFRGVPALVIGDVVRERYIHCDTSDAADDAPMLALRRLGEQAYWGGAAAMALQLRALGAEPMLIAGVGDDPASEELHQLCGENDIPCRLPLTRKGLVRVDTLLSDDTKVLRLTDGGGAPLERQVEADTFAALRDPLARSRLVVWCDHGFGTVTPGLVWAVNSAAARVGAAIVGHAPGSRGDLARLRGAHLLAMTERKLRTAMNDMESGLSSVAWTLLNQTGGRIALVSLRKRGLISFDGRRHAAADQPNPTVASAVAPFTPDRLKSEFVQSQFSAAVDLLGSDEAILAVAGLSIATGAALPVATYVAAAAEGLAVERAGRVTVPIAALRERLFARTELRLEGRFESEERVAPGAGAERVSFAASEAPAGRGS